MSTFRSCYWRIRIVGSEIFCWRTWPKCFWSRNRPWLFCLRKRGLPAWGGRLCWRYVQCTWQANKSPTNIFGSRDSRKIGSPEFLDSAKLTAMLENLLADVSNFVNSKNGAPMQFDNGLPLVDGKYVKFPIKSTEISLLRGGSPGVFLFRF